MLASASQGTAGFWVVYTVAMGALCVGAQVWWRRAQRRGESPTLVSRYRRGAMAAMLLVMLGVVRILTHSYS
jgi:hypothetical protein